jgi:hypothetical protein
MGLPAGVESVTVTGGANGLIGPGGTPVSGTVTFTPSVDRVVSAEHGLIVLGSVNATVGASGQFTLGPILATDADGFTPSGWTYRVDENLTGLPPRSYSISLPASVPTVALPDVTEVSSSSGTVVSPSVLSVNGHTGVVTGLLEAADNLSDLTSVVTARTNLGLGNAAVLSVGTSTNTVAAGDDARLSDARTPLAHAATHGVAGSDPVTVAQSQVTDLTADLALLAPLAGATFTGAVSVTGADLSVLGTGKGYRFRRGGGGLDLEATGADLIVSNWSGTAFDGTQRSYLRLSADAQNIQVAGKVEFVDALYGTTKHVLDGAADTLGFHGAAAIGQQTVLGSRADGTALASLLTALATVGLFVDGTTA